MITIRKSEDRGHANHGWLDTYHTFSFNTYHDRNHMRFRSLRVLNDDRIDPGGGFGTHPHHDMEIITYVLRGALEHKDSMGNGSVIRPGDVQRMSAGSGIRHSEFNPSQKELVHLLQIWIMPDKSGVKPSYEQKTFPRATKLDQLRLIASPTGRHGSVTIHQDAFVYATVLDAGSSVSMPIAEDRHLWVHVATGQIKLGDETLQAGDGAAISDESAITLSSDTAAEVLVFDLA